MSEWNELKAEENEKKPEFVVHKKQPDSTQVNSASNTAKKKIVVVKKKNPSVSDAPQKTEPQKKDGDFKSIKPEDFYLD